MIDDEGRLKIPLYHGTSSLFLDSIEKYGLGGYRNLQLFNKEILASLFDALKEPENYSESWDLHSFVIEKMLNEEVTNGGFNFRYGNVYLSPSKFTATNYAKKNKLGSEFLSTIYQTYQALHNVNSRKAEEIISRSSHLQAVFQGSYQPVLIKVINVSTDTLRTEQGEHINEQLNNMELMNYEELWQQFNFELKGSIEWSLLEVSYL